MTRSRTNAFFASTLVLTLLAGWAMWKGYDRREVRLRAEQRQFLVDQRASWARQDAAQAVASQQRTAERERARAAEVLKALGGPAEAAIKNPELNIQQMLEQTARLCAPSGASTSVIVDRFTEFDVAFVLPETLTVTRLAGISQCLLKGGAPYVHSIRFIQGNELVAELDGLAIESLTNSSAASVESLEGLLLASTTPAAQEPTPSH